MILEFERQFASVELCRELIALNAPAATAAIWIIEDDSTPPWIDWNRSDAAGHERVPAYSVAELGELLRRYYDQPLPMPLGDGLAGWQWCNEGPFVTGDAETEVDARASLLIHLMKTGARTGGWA